MHCVEQKQTCVIYVQIEVTRLVSKPVACAWPELHAFIINFVIPIKLAISFKLVITHPDTIASTCQAIIGRLHLGFLYIDQKQGQFAQDCFQFCHSYLASECNFRDGFHRYNLDFFVPRISSLTNYLCRTLSKELTLSTKVPSRSRSCFFPLNNPQRIEI